jgi:hypothetical protein
MPAGKRETGERRERAGAIRLDASLDDVERARDQGWRYSRQQAHHQIVEGSKLAWRYKGVQRPRYTRRKAEAVTQTEMEGEWETDATPKETDPKADPKAK